MKIEKENLEDLLSFFDDSITIADDENELVLFKQKARGFVGTHSYCMQLNGKIIKALKRVPTVIKHLKEIIKLYKLEDGVTLLLQEYQLEKDKVK